MTTEFIFGYGSLVNRTTHDFSTTHPARLLGWRRAWVHTDLRPIAYLSVVPDAGCEIDGLIMAAPHGEPGLEKRERGYDRHTITGQTAHDLDDPVAVQVYAVAQEKHRISDATHPIYLSYIDVVVQGYHREFGEAGVQGFFETTRGWDAPILNDRDDPQYPRHRVLEPQERALCDHWLDQLSAQVKQL